MSAKNQKIIQGISIFVISFCITYYFFFMNSSNEDTSKDNAIEAPVESDESTQSSIFDYIDFVDYTINYKSKIIKIPATLYQTGTTSNSGKSIKNVMGTNVKFGYSNYINNGSGITYFSVNVPKDLNCPNISYLDKAMVTFECGGDINQGNRVIEISRISEDEKDFIGHYRDMTDLERKEKEELERKEKEEAERKEKEEAEKLANSVLSFSEANKLMEIHSAGAGQIIIDKLNYDLDGMTIYLYLTESLDYPGYFCVSTVSTTRMDDFKDGILAADCGGDEKVTQFETLKLF